MIAASRRMDIGDVKRTMHGQAYLPEQLASNGFVDEILTEEEASIRLWQLAVDSYTQESTTALPLGLIKIAADAVVASCNTRDIKENYGTDE